MRYYFRSLTIFAVGMTICLAFLCSESLAATIATTGCQGTAYEKVTGKIGPTITGVVINFVSEIGQVNHTTMTDKNGAYKIALAVGRYVVTAQHPDYDVYSTSPGFFVVTAKPYQTGNIFLQKKLITTILLIRHADKAVAPPEDAPLTDLGKTRATELVHVAGKAGVKAIYATTALRSKQTVQPLATNLNIPITTYAINDYPGLKNSVLSNHAGKVVVVAGHSPTLQAIVSAFGGDASKCTLNGDEFDNLCVITVYQTGKANVINLQYGAVSPYP